MSLGGAIAKDMDFGLPKYKEAKGYLPECSSKNIVFGLPKDWIVGESDEQILYICPYHKIQVNEPKKPKIIFPFWKTIKKLFKK